MDGNIAIIKRKRNCWAHQELLKAQKRIWQTKSRLRGGPAARAPTLEQATLETASQIVVVGQRHHGKPLIEKQAGSDRSQQGHKTISELLNFQQQAEWRSCHEGADIAGKLTLPAVSPAVSANEGARHRVQASPVLSKPSGLGQRGRETSQPSYKRLTARPSGRGQQGCKILRAKVAVAQKGVDGTAAQQSKQQSKSKPVTVTAKKSETVGELLFFVQQAE